MAQQVQQYQQDMYQPFDMSLYARLERFYYRSGLHRWLVPTIIVLGSFFFVLVGSYAIGKMGLGVIAVAGVIAMIGGVLVVVRPAWGMFILVASIYTNSSDVLEVTFGIPPVNQALVGLTFVSVVGTRAIINRKPLRFGITELAIAVYMVVAAVTLFVAGDVSYGLDTLIGFMKDFIIVLILVQLCDEEGVWKRMQWIIIACAGTLSAMTLFQIVTGNYEFNFWGYSNVPIHHIVGEFDSARPTGPLNDPNYFAQMLLLTMPIAFYRFWTGETKRGRMWGLVLWLLIITAAVLSYSRSAFMAAFIIMGIIVIERKMDIVRVAVAGSVVLTAIIPVLATGLS